MLNYLRKKLRFNNPFRQIYYFLVAWLAAIRYGYPANKLTVIAVTGTKGKSTTSHMIASMLKSAGKRVGLVTTVEHWIHNEVITNRAKMTTPGRFTLQRLLKQMVVAKCSVVVVEVTSIALTQFRLYGVPVDIAVITNIQDDHLDYHGSKEAYVEAKGRLFTKLYTSRARKGVKKTAILSRDDEYFDFYNQYAADRKITFGLRKGDVSAQKMEHFAHGTVFTLKLPNQTSPAYIPFPGKFNIYNALAATSVMVGLGFDVKTIVAGLEALQPVPGRVESIVAGQEFTVIVDYAHTEESLKQLLELFKSLTKGKLIVVFGATGGGRDKRKRPKMGAVADEYADTIILTDDDPYDDDRMEIINDIAKGIKRAEGHNMWKVPSRREAIRLALTMARKNDVVVIAGKGGEPVMYTRAGLIPWNDSEVVKELLTREVEVALDDGEMATGENKCFVS